jgi:hypothetical protein
MMTPNEQNKAIAKYCSWTHHESTSETGDVDIWMNGPFSRYSPPDYHSDLNAMHEAERKLSHEQLERYDKYLFKLQLENHNKWISGSKHEIYSAEKWIFHATSQQRAEAFLRTIGKWKE